MKSYTKIKEPKLPATIPAIRKLDNGEWKERIFYYLLLYYRQTDNNAILKIIEFEIQKPRANIETAIKNHLLRWFRNNPKFNRNGFILNREPSSEGEKVGFYDLKFQHSYWNNTETYFVFECKNLGKSKSITLSKSIDEYVYVKEQIKGKIREDGGMFRYFTEKYAINQNFGGMIGFIIGKLENSIIETLINKINLVYDDNEIGKLTKEKIIRNSIENNENTFDSIHIRKSHKTKQ